MDVQSDFLSFIQCAIKIVLVFDQKLTIVIRINTGRVDVCLNVADQLLNYWLGYVWSTNQLRRELSISQ